MGGPNLEVFKFSVYVFFPVVMLLYYGNPDWYAKNVLPVRFAFSLVLRSFITPHHAVQGQDLPS